MRHSFTKELVGETGLVYMYQRWYLPEVGVFASRSPYGPRREPPYLYANQNPCLFLDSNGKEPKTRWQEEFCKNDPCKGQTVTSGKGNTYSGGEACEGDCFAWANSESNNHPDTGDKPWGSGWHLWPGGEVIYYHGAWNQSGHGAIFDPTTGCAASCTKGDWTGTIDPGAPDSSMRVVVHHPYCHPRGQTDSPWHWPIYYY